jgi:hypothetical protein
VVNVGLLKTLPLAIETELVGELYHNKLEGN